MTALYDDIGRGYADRRRPDPRIAARINAALGDAQRVVNVGAGTGSYEPHDRAVVAIEPSRVMIDQRPPISAPVVQGQAEALPVPDGAFDAALAILTVHHWRDHRRGIAEMRRVSNRQVVFAWDPAFNQRFWLTEEYLPAAILVDEDVATFEAIVTLLPPVDVGTIAVPHDCTDGFYGAYWRRPEAFLDATVRDAISVFALMDQTALAAGLKRLRTDLDSGEWHRRHADLLELDELDLGYRLIVAGD